MMKQNKFIKRIFAYFVRGLILVGPIYLTIYIILQGIRYLDNIVPVSVQIAGKNVYLPGVGLIIIFSIIILLGFVVSKFIPQSFFSFGENVLKRLPLVGLIYYAIKDLITAFVGNKKKFSQPVVVTINEQSNMKKLGFLTQNDLINLSLDDHVAVYCPHSYAFSGELFLVPSKNIELLNISSTEVMKMIVSGGVSIN